MGTYRIATFGAALPPRLCPAALAARCLFRSTVCSRQWAPSVRCVCVSVATSGLPKRVLRGCRERCPGDACGGGRPAEHHTCGRTLARAIVVAAGGGAHSILVQKGDRRSG